MSANFRQEVIEREEMSQSLILETIATTRMPESVALVPIDAKASGLLY